MDTQSNQENAGWQLWVAVAFLVLLVAGPIVAVARIAAPSDGLVLAQAPPLDPPAGLTRSFPDTAPASNPDIGDFAFGYIEFDWNPKAPGGVPGFDSWPPGSRRR